MICEKEQDDGDGFIDSQYVLRAKSHFLSLPSELNSLIHYSGVGNGHLQVLSDRWLGPSDSTIGATNADLELFVGRTDKADGARFLTTPEIQFGAELFLRLDDDVAVAVIEVFQRGSLIEQPPLAHVVPLFPWMLAAGRFPKTPRQTSEYTVNVLP